MPINSSIPIRCSISVFRYHVLQTVLMKECFRKIYFQTFLIQYRYLKYITLPRLILRDNRVVNQLSIRSVQICRFIL